MQLSIHHNQPPEPDTINHHQISTPIYAAIYRRQIYTGFDHRQHLGDALSAMSCLRPVDVFFLRGDSGGEGGSGLFLLGPERLPLTLSLIKPNGTLVADRATGFDWLPGLISGDRAQYRVGDRVISFNDAQPWSEQRLFAMTVA